MRLRIKGHKYSTSMKFTIFSLRFSVFARSYQAYPCVWTTQATQYLASVYYFMYRILGCKKKIEKQFRKSQSYNFTFTFIMQHFRWWICCCCCCCIAHIPRTVFVQSQNGLQSLSRWMYPGKSQIPIKSYQASFSFARALSDTASFPLHVHVCVIFFHTLKTTFSLQKIWRCIFLGALVSTTPFKQHTHKLATKLANGEKGSLSIWQYGARVVLNLPYISSCCALCMCLCLWLSTWRPYFFPFVAKELKWYGSYALSCQWFVHDSIFFVRQV